MFSITAWGLDEDLDGLCVNKLGMLKPVQPFSFGLLTRGRLTLMFPGWYICGHEENIAGALEGGINPNDIHAHITVPDEKRKCKVRHPITFS